jgi:hypothetical protein
MRMAHQNHNKDSGGQEAARVLQAASEQIALALKDSQPSVDALSASLAKLAALLGEDLSSADARPKLAQLCAEMTRAVTGMQFHDRMTQHLTHVRDYLAGSAEQIGAESGVPCEPWAGLHRKLADRLLSETHRMYLGKNFPAEFIANRGTLPREERGAASAGDIDLF